MGPLLIRGDARALPLPDASVDLIVTSPPYFGLRSYTDGGEHYAGQVGAEATPAEFIGALVTCTREWKRVLKPSGSIFVNLGDKYNAHPTGHKAGDTAHDKDGRSTGYQSGMGKSPWGGLPKSLLLLPERYRIAAVDRLGLIARAVIVWSKPNGLPESVTDRVRRSHEDWVHLTKQPRYFASVDEIREPHAPASGGRGPRMGKAYLERQNNGGGNAGNGTDNFALGKLPGSVWEIVTQPLVVPPHLGVDHYAAFPMEWPARLILGWCPREVCTRCGEGRRPVTDKTHIRLDNSVVDGDVPGLNNRHVTAGRGRRAVEATITGYACACPDTTAPATPGVVLDPFGGTGTTALVAAALGYTGISVDLSADYCRLADWRTHDRGQRARARAAAQAKPPSPTRTGPRDVFLPGINWPK